MEYEEEKPTPAQGVAGEIFGYMAGKVKIVGDIVGPITPLEDWECMKAAAR